MNKITYNHLLIFLISSSTFALSLAYISQYGFDLQPCILCFYQRKPFFAVIILAILGLTLINKKRWQKLLINISALLLLGNAILGLYHVGVENKIFTGPTTCSSISEEPVTLEELQAELKKIKPIRCDEPAFVFLGISMAGWNVFYCLGIVALIFVIRRRKSGVRF